MILRLKTGIELDILEIKIGQIYILKNNSANELIQNNLNELTLFELATLRQFYLAIFKKLNSQQYKIEEDTLLAKIDHLVEVRNSILNLVEQIKFPE